MLRIFDKRLSYLNYPSQRDIEQIDLVDPQNVSERFLSFRQNGGEAPYFT